MATIARATIAMATIAMATIAMATIAMATIAMATIAMATIAMASDIQSNTSKRRLNPQLVHQLFANCAGYNIFDIFTIHSLNLLFNESKLYTVY